MPFLPGQGLPTFEEVVERLEQITSQSQSAADVALAKDAYNKGMAKLILDIVQAGLVIGAAGPNPLTGGMIT